MPLLTGPGTLGAGSHRLPFALALPRSLPPTWAMADGGSSASVSYKIKVFVDQVRRCVVAGASTRLQMLDSPPPHTHI